MHPKPFFPRLVLIGLILPCLVAGFPNTAGAEEEIRLPLDMAVLREALSHARAEVLQEMAWPRKIIYDQGVFDARRKAFRYTVKSFVVPEKPVRIIPNSVDVAEILWAVCPRDRIAAFNRASADPGMSFIADPVRNRFPVFSSQQPEAVIEYRPDLVLSADDANPDLPKRLSSAKIPYLDLGYCGSVQSMRKRIRLIGKAIGEMGNAEALVRVMDETIQKMTARIPKSDARPRVIRYEEGGSVAGLATNFEFICRIIGAVNVAAERKVTGIQRIDPETLLKWNPDLIVVPEEAGVKEQLLQSEILSRVRAVQNGNVHAVPRVYLNAGSQFILLSANLLAGIVYNGAF